MRVRYRGDMSIGLATELRINYPTPLFMSLPLMLRVNYIELEGTWHYIDLLCDLSCGYCNALISNEISFAVIVMH